MEFKIIPFIGAEDIRFGMSRRLARSFFSSNRQTFKKNLQDIVPCDYYEKEGVFLYYDQSQQLEAIEFMKPSRPHLAHCFLLEKPFIEAKQKLAQLTNELSEEADGAIAWDIGVSIYSPLAKEDPMAPVDSVLVFRKGYYD